MEHPRKMNVISYLKKNSVCLNKRKLRLNILLQNQKQFFCIHELKMLDFSYRILKFQNKNHFFRFFDNNESASKKY